MKKSTVMYIRYLIFRSFFVLIFFIGLILIPCPYPTLAHSAQVTIAWDPNTDPNIAGYKVYYGYSSRNYPFVCDTGNHTTCAISGLEEGKTYYFAATAYDLWNNESSYSKEVSYAVPMASITFSSGGSNSNSDSGGSNSSVGSFSNNNAGEGNNTGTSVGDYVDHFYRQILERNSGLDEQSHWTNGLVDGSYSGADVAYGFIFSQEFINRNTSNEEFITILYRAFFNRDPDPGGFNNWVSALYCGTSRKDVLEGFIYSQEFENLCNTYAINQYGGASVSSGGVEDFVTRFYQQCLGREPDIPGLNGWVNALLDGTLCGADVANAFIFSEEFINRNTSNEEFVIILYRAFFDREPDTSGYNGWVNYLYSGATRQAVLNGFIYSQEFENLCDRYGIAPYSA